MLILSPSHTQLMATLGTEQQIRAQFRQTAFACQRLSLVRLDESLRIAVTRQERHVLGRPPSNDLIPLFYVQLKVLVRLIPSL